MSVCCFPAVKLKGACTADCRAEITSKLGRQCVNALIASFYVDRRLCTDACAATSTGGQAMDQLLCTYTARERFATVQASVRK